MAINIYLSTITLNTNGLNAPIKRQPVTEWTTKQDPYASYKRFISNQHRHTN